MARVKMLTGCETATGKYEPGKTYDLERGEAAWFVSQGWAEAAKGEVKTAEAHAPAAETAEAAPKTTRRKVNAKD